MNLKSLLKNAALALAAAVLAGVTFVAGFILVALLAYGPGVGVDVVSLARRPSGMLILLALFLLFFCLLRLRFAGTGRRPARA